MLCVLSSFLRSERETPLLVDFAAGPPHAVAPVLPSRRLPERVFALVLPARLLLEEAAQDPRDLIPALRSFRRCWFALTMKRCLERSSSIRWYCPLLSRQLARATILASSPRRKGGTVKVGNGSHNFVKITLRP
jgi:hypothetical protein